MIEETRILLIVNIILIVIAIIIAIIYLLPITFIRRFHTPSNILTGNFCVAGVICCLYWVVFNILSGFYPTIISVPIISCVSTQYLATMVNCLLVYSLVMITVDRFFIVVYPTKRLFKTQMWSWISFSVQWLLAIILPLPRFLIPFQSCMSGIEISIWVNIYDLLIVVIFPSILNIILNLIVFFSVYSSTRRVHALTMTTDSARHSIYQHARDIHLLKHIILLFIVFVSGWAPLYIYLVVDPIGFMSSSISLFINILPVLSSLINMADLFYYNHEIRHYLKERFLKCLGFNQH